MNTKQLSIFPLVLLCVTQLFALGKFKFEKEVHDFGIVNEGDMAVYEFVFKNIGDEPIIMTNVRASCGCTTPFFTKDPVMPGKEGKIKVQYNSSGRMGVFNKSITITSNAEPATKVVYIKGIVEHPVDLSKYSAEELKNAPAISLEKTEHSFGEVQQHSDYTYKFKYTNTGTAPLKISSVSSGCNCVSYTTDKEVLKKGESAVLTITYKPRIVGDVTDLVYVHTNDLKSPKTEIKLKAKVLQSLSNQSLMNQGQKTGF